NDKLNKRVIGQEVWQKKSISTIPIDKMVTNEWIKQVFHDLTETIYTRDLSRTFFEHVEKSETFVDFFARLTFQLFGDDGIVLIDSGDETLRQLESETFEQLIH